MTGSVFAFSTAALAQLSGGARSTVDGGTGTYVAIGRSYDFNLVNSGSTSWRSFYLVAPATIGFVGGTTGNEASASCVVGLPDGGSTEIECGPLSASTVPPQGHIAFVATVSRTSVCGVSFELFVSSADGEPYTRGDDVTPAADCASAVTPRAEAPPTLHGTPTPGSTIRATPPTWSSPPSQLSYRWEVCTGATCVTIPGATGLTLALTRREVGRTVRLLATATIAGERVRTSSRPLLVRARR